MFATTIVLAAMAAAVDAHAADAGNGKRLADNHCAPCHTVAPQARNEVADAAPFDVIGRKYGSNADVLANVILGPHPKMNFSPQPAEAADLAAYIATLGR
jgi:mono/diheme cytochrome c family protein